MQDFLDLDNIDLDFPSMASFGLDTNEDDMPSFFEEATATNTLKRDRTSEEEQPTYAPTFIPEVVEVPVVIEESIVESKPKKTKKRPQRKEQRRDFLEAKVSKLETENMALFLDLKLLQKEDDVLSEQLALLQNAQARALGFPMMAPLPMSGKLASNPAPMLMQCVPTIVSRSEIA